MPKLRRKLILLVFTISYLHAAHAQEAQFPIVKDYGGIYTISDVVEFPAKDIVYNIVVDLKTGASGHTAISPALNNLARMVNLHGLGGVPKEQMKVVAVMHGEATVAILTDEAYESRFGAKNPNANLIRSLKEAGVRLFVCGQSIKARKIEPSELAPGIDISLSAVTVLTTYQLDGYAILSF